jgi:hypothetical protein
MTQPLSINRLPNLTVPSVVERALGCAPNAGEVITFVNEIIGDDVSSRLTYKDGSETVSEFPWEWEGFNFHVARRTSVDGGSTHTLQMSGEDSSLLTVIADRSSDECDILLKMRSPLTGSDNIAFSRSMFGTNSGLQSDILGIGAVDIAETLHTYLTKLRECLNEN